MEGISSFLPFIAMFAVVYFFMIAPQMKVITKSGMHGRIAELNDKDSSCIIETMSGKIKFDRSAVSMEMSQKLNTDPATTK